jgi:ATP adenylyltransferase
VVPEHFILATKDFEKQTDLLGEADLDAAYACIRAYAKEGRELFAFFNSGEHSGASQPHRHLQLLEVANMKEGLGEKDGWEVLADGLVEKENRRKLPFWTAAERIKGETLTGKELREVYVRLYRRACEKLGTDARDQTEGEARISYNLALTKDVMVVCPRVGEGAAVTGEDGKEVGWLALNGTVLAGTALVKNQAEWDALRRDPGQLEAVLGKIGVPTESKL